MLTLSFEEYPPQLRSLFTKVAEAGFGDILTDEQRGNEFLCSALTQSRDPILREIGQQLQDGSIRLGEIADSSHYREVMNRGLESLEGLDPERLEADLDTSLNSQELGSRDEDDDRAKKQDQDPEHGDERSGEAR